MGSAKLSEDKVVKCANKMVTKMEKKHKRCAKMYTSDDMDQLRELGLKVASYKCFEKQFAKSCAEFKAGDLSVLYGEDDTIWSRYYYCYFSRYYSRLYYFRRYYHCSCLIFIIGYVSYLIWI